MSKIQDLIDDIDANLGDANRVGEEYHTMTLEEWKSVLGSLEIIHYLCMDARKIVKQKIKKLQKKE